MIAEKQHYKCALSGCDLTPETVGADHIIPYAHGGTHEIGNIQLITRELNSMKGTLTQKRFIELCIEVANHHGKTISE